MIPDGQVIDRSCTSATFREVDACGICCCGDLPDLSVGVEIPMEGENSHVNGGYSGWQIG